MALNFNTQFFYTLGPELFAQFRELDFKHLVLSKINMVPGKIQSLSQLIHGEILVDIGLFLNKIIHNSLC
jgi:hypothetical protein